MPPDLRVARPGGADVRRIAFRKDGDPVNTEIRHEARALRAHPEDDARRDTVTIMWRFQLPCPDSAACLMVLAAALWGTAAAVSEAEPRAASPADGTLTAIVGATVVHPELEGAAASSSDSTVIMAGKRIKAVGPAITTKVPRGARVIDGHGKWVIPGLIDSHVHFFQSGNLYTRPDAADFGAWRPYAAEVQRNQARLPQTFRVWLASGVTSVADVGGPFWNFQVRDAARNSAAAPRVAVTGPLISMVEDPKLDLGDPPIVRINSAEEARQLVARELERKPDYIKVWFIHRPGDDLAAQESIVRATAEAAHAAGLRLAVHATELLVAKSALHAGAGLPRTLRRRRTGGRGIPCAGPRTPHPLLPDAFRPHGLFLCALGHLAGHRGGAASRRPTGSGRPAAR